LRLDPALNSGQYQPAVDERGHRLAGLLAAGEQISEDLGDGG
jgi:hypothetical protein